MVRAVRSKILGPLFAAQQAAPRITKPGSITFTSGVAASRPANAVAFLIADNFVTGTVLHAEGAQVLV